MHGLIAAFYSQDRGFFSAYIATDICNKRKFLHHIRFVNRRKSGRVPSKLLE
jgi:hypothetical protein